MQLSGNTVLITGGTSGIGFELAKAFLALGNTVIITGRDQEKLRLTQEKLPGVHIFQSDVSDPQAIVALHEKITSSFPSLNVLINNAGIMRKLNLHSQADLVDTTREIETNLLGPIWMVKQFLPHLKGQPSAAIVNVSSGLAFVPMAISPVYCAAKSAIHSFTQSLRLQLSKTNVQVFEVAPPGTETPLFRGEFTDQDLGGVRGMAVSDLAQRVIAGLQHDRTEIRLGIANVLRFLSRLAPAFILRMLNRSSLQLLLSKG